MMDEVTFPECSFEGPQTFFTVHRALSARHGLNVLSECRDKIPTPNFPKNDGRKVTRKLINGMWLQHRESVSISADMRRERFEPEFYKKPPAECTGTVIRSGNSWALKERRTKAAGIIKRVIQADRQMCITAGKIWHKCAIESRHTQKPLYLFL